MSGTQYEWRVWRQRLWHWEVRRLRRDTLHGSLYPAGGLAGCAYTERGAQRLATRAAASLRRADVRLARKERARWRRFVPEDGER